MKTNGLKPVIGISMSLDMRGMIRDGIDYSFIRREYGEQLKAAGASPIFLDNSIDPEIAAELCDGIVISGGEDIESHFYKQEAKYLQITEPLQRTEWERKLIDACDMRKVRILGICYGSQLLNVHYGGTLYQDIAKETSSKLSHGSTAAPAIHKVTFKSKFLSFKSGEIVESASRHHQAVNKLGKGMKAVAVAEDGIIEAISGNGHFGVQWHAESDDTAAKIYGAFVELVKQPILDDNEGFALDPSLQPDLA